MSLEPTIKASRLLTFFVSNLDSTLFVVLVNNLIIRLAIKRAMKIWPLPEVGQGHVPEKTTFLKNNLIHHFESVSFLWLSHEMGRHYVFMLIIEFFDSSENFYRSGRVTMSTLRVRGCPSVCRQIKRTSTQKVTSRFSRFIHIWIKLDVEKKVMKRRF